MRRKFLVKGRYAVEKIKYGDGIGCCLWYIIDKKTPDTGLCWDFSYKDLDTILYLLRKLKEIKPTEFKDEA